MGAPFFQGPQHGPPNLQGLTLGPPSNVQGPYSGPPPSGELVANSSSQPGIQLPGAQQQTGFPPMQPVSFLQPALQSVPRRQIAKLQKIPLPEFSGDPTQFTSFWDCFQSQVDDQPDLAPVDKFRFLKGLLKGNAADTVAGIQVTNDNYVHAVHALKERYGSKHVLKQTLLSQLREISKSGPKVQDLQQTHDAVEKILRQLESLGVDLNQMMLVNEVISKFPAAIALEMERTRNSDEDWSMLELRKCVKSVISVRSRAFLLDELDGSSIGGAVGGSTTAKAMSSKPKPRFKYNEPSRKNESMSSMNRLVCPFCSENHFASACQQYKFADTRAKCLSAKKLCHLCFKPGHFKPNCPKSNNPKPCHFCSQPYHNQALCPKKFGQNIPNHPSKQPKHNAQTQQQNKAKQQNAKGKNSRTFISAQYTAGSLEENEAEQNVPSNSATLGTLGAIVSMHVHDGNQANKPNVVDKPKMKKPEDSIDMLPTATATVFNPNNQNYQCLVRTIIDTGSEKSYITKKVSQDLHLTPEKDHDLNVLSFGKEQATPISTKLTKIFLLLQNGATMEIMVNIMPGKITGSIHRPCLSNQDLQFLKPFEQNLSDKLPEKPEDYHIDLLLGADVSFYLLMPTSPMGLPSGLLLIPSKLGFILSGTTLQKSPTAASQAETNPDDQDQYKMTISAPAILQAEQEPCELDLTTMWSLQNIGITDSPDVTQDDEALQRFQKWIKFDQGRYYLSWMWKDEHPDLPDNRDVAMRRFVSLMKRFASDPAHTLLKACDNIIKDQLLQNILEKVPDESIVEGPLHYLPHTPVVTPGKQTTKVRIVMDASAKANHTSNSLNDCLYRGPIILPALLGMLLRFRMGYFAVCSDVAKAFLQLKLHSHQRDCTRIFWVKDPNHSPLWASENILVLRFTSVLFGSKCSPSMLNLTIDFHLSTYTDSVAELIQKNMYVDNFITSANSVMELVHIYKRGTEMFRDMGMHLREWNSNSKGFMDNVKNEDRMAPTESVSILGIKWNLEEDTLCFDKMHSLDGPLTKRKALEITSSCFDPFGVLNPLFLGPKIFLQKLWKLQVGWDQPLNQELSDEFEQLLSEVKAQMGFKIPRYYQLPQVTFQLGLVCFSDASQDAYAANVYLCIFMEKITVGQLLFSKMRLKPMKGMSIPRMELLGVVIGVKSLEFASKEIHKPIVSQTLFCDSQCVLYWLKSNKRKPIFVENRVQFIKRNQHVDFQYVDTESNPADLATRSQSAESFNKSLTMWLHGPKFMELTKEKWPKFHTSEISVSQIDEWEAEDYTKKPKDAVIMLNAVERITEPFIDPTRFSRWKSLLFFTSCVLLCVSKLIWSKLSSAVKEKHKILSQLLSFDCDKGLTSDIFEKANYYWIHISQMKHYQDVQIALIQGTRHKLVKQLRLFLDAKGLIRLQGRIQNAPISFDSKHPILLHHQSPITQLLIPMKRQCIQELKQLWQNFDRNFG